MRVRRTTLKQQIIITSLIIAGLALLLAVILLFGAEALSLQEAMVRDVTIKANIIGNQSAAALLFNVKEDAGETLGALRADAQIEYAAVYTSRGGLFASYRSDGSRIGPPPQPRAEDGARFSLTHLEVTHPIVLRSERIGTVVIRSNLRNLFLLLARYGLSAGIVLLIAMVMAFFLVSRLQRRVTEPVTALVQVIGRISRDEDLTVRAAESGPEELRVLADRFNEMVSAIQARDRDLQQNRRELENLVASLQRSSGELQEAYRKLETLDELKSDFISTVSHELRTPITAIKAFVELILMKPDMQRERLLRLLETVNRETDRLGRLINDLLDLSRIESGMMKWKDEELSLHEVIQAAVDGMAPLLKNRNIRLTVEGTGVPAPAVADRDRMTQIMTNLLSNAVKFTPEGGAVSVSVRNERVPLPQIVVSVSDTGPGIPPEEIERIFDKFHRSDDMLDNKVEGSGLGLSISRQIVEHYGGRIWATSERGKGSTFAFSIPLPADRAMTASSSR